jgi:tripartite-type tricarboxylate transporter receptor subunit TctC
MSTSRISLPGPRRRHLLALAAGSALAAGTTRTFAQAFPNRPISIVVPYPPGASTDMLARLVAQPMQASLGVPVVVENKGGAGGNVGAAYVAKSPPDGYRILLATQPIMTINPYVYKETGFDVAHDFTPLTCGVNAVVCIAVHPSLGVNTLAELITYGKAHPGALNFGTAGAGSPQHIGGLLFAQRAGFTWTHIPYRGGGPMVTDLISGQIKVGIVTLSTVKGYIADGRLKVLAIGEKTRFGGTPQIPTIAETLPGFELSTWLAFFGPGNLPPDITQTLSRHLVQALNVQSVKTKLHDSALPVRAEGPAALAQLVSADQAIYSRTIREHHITID